VSAPEETAGEFASRLHDWLWGDLRTVAEKLRAVSLAVDEYAPRDAEPGEASWRITALAVELWGIVDKFDAEVRKAEEADQRRPATVRS